MNKKVSRKDKPEEILCADDYAEEKHPFDEVMRKLLKAKPQHRIGKAAKRKKKKN